MKKSKTITIPASDIDGMKYNSFEVSVLFQLDPEPMKLGEGRMEWLKNQRIKPIEVKITTVGDLKPSEKLHQKASEEENDIKAIGMHLSAYAMEYRENNKERFDKEFLPLLKQFYVVEENNDFCKVDTQTYGTITIYPKADKVNIRKGNRWINRNGMAWITKNLFNGMK